MSDGLVVKDIYSDRQSYGRWVVSAVYGYKDEAVVKEKAPGAWIHSETGSATVILRLGASPQELADDFMALAILAEQGLFDGLLGQLPERVNSDQNFEC